MKDKKCKSSSNFDDMLQIKHGTSVTVKCLRVIERLVNLCNAGKRRDTVSYTVMM